MPGNWVVLRAWRAFCGSTFSSVLNQQDEILLPQRDTMEILSSREKESGLGTPVREPCHAVGWVRQPGIGGRSTSVRPPRPPRGDFCRPRRWRAVCLHANHRHPSLRKTQHPAAPTGGCLSTASVLAGLRPLARAGHPCRAIGWCCGLGGPPPADATTCLCP